MEVKQFNDIVEKRCRLIKTILASKAKEYAKGDRLHNFKRAASARCQKPETALLGMLMKHEVSIWDIVDDIENGYAPENLLELSREKIGDAINYLILLEALIEERVETAALGRKEL